MSKAFTLVTGASLGIGLEIARVAARNGRNVILTARSADKLEAVADDLRKAYGVEVVVIRADLSADGAVPRLWEAATDGRRIDFLVNNAGLGAQGAFVETEWAREERSLDVNVVALTALCKHAVAHMEAGGRILNVASVAGFLPGPSMAVYHAGKAYVLSFSVALNEELRGKRITVTALCPGATQSNFFADADMGEVKFIKGKRLPTAASVAEYGYGAAIGGRAVAVPGLMNQATVFLARVLPWTVQAALVRRIFGTM